MRIAFGAVASLVLIAGVEAVLISTTVHSLTKNAKQLALDAGIDISGKVDSAIQGEVESKGKASSEEVIDAPASSV